MPEIDDPLFVNRRTQLELFADVLAVLAHGERRHVALLGLRRIGKTMLIDEVRTRHRDACTVKIPVDVAVSTPEGFALEVVAAVLREVARVQGSTRTVTTQEAALAATAALLGEPVLAHTEEIVNLLRERGAYGRLIAKALAFPAEVSDALGLPILVFLDEFQDLRRLRNFPGTDVLWAALREVLDRRGRVAFTVAGSIVTALRKILGNGNDPLFSRFEELLLPPFEEEDTFALATGVWDRVGLAWDHNAARRVYTLSQGFPFYTHTLARAAADRARGASTPIRDDHVDDAFQHQLLNRDSPLAIYLQYLFAQAIAGVKGENIPDAVLRYLARHEGARIADVARALRREHGVAQIRDVVAELVDIDILTRRDDGGVWFVDPLLPLWIALERERQEPGPLLADPRTRARVPGMLEERIRALENAMGPLFETRVHNVLRQFRGQTVSARLFGQRDGTVVLPTITDVQNLVLPDPRGELDGRPGSVEVDGYATGSETWILEAKHQKGGVTRGHVDRLLRKRQFLEAHGRGPVSRAWMVSHTGFREDARERCDEADVWFTNARQLATLERALRR